MTNENIPFLDLVSVHRGLQGELVDVLKTALNNAGFIGGPMVKGLKKTLHNFAKPDSASAWAAARTPCDSP